PHPALHSFPTRRSSDLDTKAAECLKFVYQKFYLPNQQIAFSSAANSYNRAYQQLQAFSGFKPYNDSAGGYAGSPASVWQEGTWGDRKSTRLNSSHLVIS